jgi:hypothetical protein
MVHQAAHMTLAKTTKRLFLPVILILSLCVWMLALFIGSSPEAIAWQWHAPGRDHAGNSNQYVGSGDYALNSSAYALGNGVATGGMPAIRDIDDDGDMETVIASSTGIYIYEGDTIIAQKSTSTILGRPETFNVNVSVAGREIVVCEDGNISYYSYDANVPEIRKLKSFTAEPGMTRCGLYCHQLYDTTRHCALHTNDAFLLYDSLGTLEFNVSLPDDAKAAEVYSTDDNAYGDIDGDIDTDYHFWHNASIYAIDSLGGTEWKQNVRGTASTSCIYTGQFGDIYNPITYCDFDGGYDEIVTSTNHADSLNGRSCFISMRSDGTFISRIRTQQGCISKDWQWSNPTCSDAFTASGEEAYAFTYDTCLDRLRLYAYDETGEISDYERTQAGDSIERIMRLSVAEFGTNGNMPTAFLYNGNGQFDIINVTFDASPLNEQLEFTIISNSTVGGEGDDIILADLNDDSNLDYISRYDGSSVNGVQYLYGNLEPGIITLYWDTGNPVCINSTVTYSVSYLDMENDAAAIRADCTGEGFGSYGSYTTVNPSVTCTYPSLGSYTTTIQITDAAHAPEPTANATHAVTVTLSNCNGAGEGGGYDEGIGGNITVPEYADGYTPTHVDLSDCEEWKTGYRAVFYGLCPVKEGGETVLFGLFGWIFSGAFGVFLMLVLIVVIIVVVRRRRQ